MTVLRSGFVSLLVFVSVMFLSAGGFFAFADQDYRLRHTDTTVSIIQDDQARDFDDLDTHERQIFEEATKSEGYTSEDPIEFPDRVRRNDTYYDFKYTSTYDWTNPSTVFPTLTFLGGLLGVTTSIRRDLR